MVDDCRTCKRSMLLADDADAWITTYINSRPVSRVCPTCATDADVSEADANGAASGERVEVTEGRLVDTAMLANMNRRAVAREWVSLEDEIASLAAESEHFCVPTGYGDNEMLLCVFRDVAVLDDRPLLKSDGEEHGRVVRLGLTKPTAWFIQLRAQEWMAMPPVAAEGSELLTTAVKLAGEYLQAAGGGE